MTRSATVYRKRRLPKAEARAERRILRALKLVTAPAPTLEKLPLDPAARSTAERVRNTFATPNVVGVGMSEKVTRGKGTGMLALTFYVERKIPLRRLSGLEALPPALAFGAGVPEAVPIDVVELGRLQLEAGPNVKRNPIQPGFSIGHRDVTAGTLGAIVTPQKTYRILSNSHVLAKSGLAKLGDAILYPGPADNGRNPQDLVAELSRIVPFVVGGEFVNIVDCALAKPIPGRLADLRSRIPRIGPPRGVVEPHRGMKIVKIGRTTRKTTGEVRDIHFRFVLRFERIGDVGFRDQILCTRYTKPGDSGSLVLERDTNLAVGLHFAGASGGSVCNPIAEVLRKLRVKLVTGDISKDA
jgi:hypothetical protein